MGTTAIAFRKPMIVTNVGGLPELVKTEQAIVEPDNAQALTEAVVAILGNEEKLKQLSLDTDLIAENFSWTTIADKTVEVYKKVCLK